MGMVDDVFAIVLESGGQTPSISLTCKIFR